MHKLTNKWVNCKPQRTWRLNQASFRPLTTNWRQKTPMKSKEVRHRLTIQITSHSYISGRLFYSIIIKIPQMTQKIYKGHQTSKSMNLLSLRKEITSSTILIPPSKNSLTRPLSQLEITTLQAKNRRAPQRGIIPSSAKTRPTQQQIGKM